MQSKKRLEKIFTKENLPPVFGENFKAGNYDWKKLTGIDFETVGRILVCHLLLEQHLNKLIELRTPVNFNWNESRLTFTQKLNLLKKDHAFAEYKFFKGLEVINKIRNKYSHSLEVQIAETDLRIISEINSSSKKKQTSHVNEEFEHSQIAIIESFTLFFCSYIAGYCTCMVDGILSLTKTKTVVNRTDNN